MFICYGSLRPSGHCGCSLYGAYWRSSMYRSPNNNDRQYRSSAHAWSSYLGKVTCIRGLENDGNERWNSAFFLIETLTITLIFWSCFWHFKMLIFIFISNALHLYTVVLVTLLTFKFQQIVRSWYSVQVTFVCTALWKKLIRKQSAKYVQNPSKFTKVTAKYILVCF